MYRHRKSRSNGFISIAPATPTPNPVNLPRVQAFQIAFVYRFRSVIWLSSFANGFMVGGCLLLRGVRVPES